MANPVCTSHSLVLSSLVWCENERRLHGTLTFVPWHTYVRVWRRRFVLVGFFYRPFLFWAQKVFPLPETWVETAALWLIDRRTKITSARESLLPVAAATLAASAALARTCFPFVVLVPLNIFNLPLPVLDVFFIDFDRHPQASCSRPAAVNALKKNDGDIVNAIMELTMD